MPTLPPMCRQLANLAAAPTLLRWRAALAALLAAPLMAAPINAGAAQLGISPVLLKLGPAADRSSMTVTNQGLEPVMIQAEVVHWRRLPVGTPSASGGGAPAGVAPPAGDASDDLIINPPMFRVMPGQTQVLRIGLRQGAPAHQESTYRVVLRELPSAEPTAAAGGQVKVLMAVQVPVYVEPVKVVRQAHWQAQVDAGGRVQVQVRNDGNVHLRVNRLRVVQGGQGAVVQSPGVAGVLFPGEQRQFEWRDPAAAGQREARLEVLTGEGPALLPLSAASR